jgi:hypothetical protein
MSSSSTYKHGLTPLQLEVKVKQIAECKKKGVKGIQCGQCKKMTSYCYTSFPKRGGTKYLYCCEVCFFTSSRLDVSEEDYDFLSN